MDNLEDKLNRFYKLINKPGITRWTTDENALPRSEEYIMAIISAIVKSFDEETKKKIYSDLKDHFQAFDKA